MHLDFKLTLYLPFKIILYSNANNTNYVIYYILLGDIVMNESSNVYDEKLMKAEIFKKIPAFLPYVGPNYKADDHSKLLLIAKNFYLPEISDIHLDSDKWYNCTQKDLTKEEITWINCRDLLQCDWVSLGHKIYRELNRCFDSEKLKYTDRPISTISFMNGFLRPGDYQIQSKDYFTPIDFECAINTITFVINTIQPNHVIFTSKYLWDKVGRKIDINKVSAKLDCTCSPVDPRHWDVQSYPDGHKKFLEILDKHFYK